MRSLPGFALLPMAMLAITATGATAQDGDPRATFPKKVQGCFKRVYDAAHLARNPGQSVAMIALSRGPAELKLEAIEGPEAPSYAFRLSLALRNGVAAGPEPLGCDTRQADEGEHGGKRFLQCASACGRGHFDLRTEGADRIIVMIGGTVQGRFIADAIGLGRSCASDAGLVWLGDEPGDRTFVLDRVSLQGCRR
jgi:hypothetical protein